MPSSRTGPGALVWIHPLTIAAGVAGALAYALWEISGGAAGAWWRGGAALVVAAGLALYLGSLRGRLGSRLTPRQSFDDR